jgi:hypothetical protein
MPSPTFVVQPTATPLPDVEAWRGEYFANRDLVGQPVLVRYDREVNFSWSTGSPADAVPADGFSVRWTRTLPLQAGMYRFFARIDDGVRVWVDGQLLIDQWHSNPAVTYSAERSLGSGPHTVRIEYFEDQGFALVQFWWVRAGEFPDWRGAYFPNRDLLGSPAVVRNDASIDFDFGRGIPAPGLPADGFSVRWTRQMAVDPGVYRFRAFVDDGVRLFVDDVLVIDAWESGSAREVTGERELSAGSHFLRVEYFENTGVALVRVTWERVPVVSFPDWKGEYWDNRTLSGDAVLARNDESVSFDWGSGSPHPSVPDDNFSTRWTRTASFDAATYRFNVLVDDGARLWLDGRLIIDEWKDGSARQVSQEVAVALGTHHVRVEYYERSGDARILVWWEKVTMVDFPDWKGQYWVNRTLSGDPVLVRNDESINFDWGSGSPEPSIPADSFSVRWTRTATFDAATYRFHLVVDDGARLWLDDQLIINAWEEGAVREITAEHPVVRGPHAIRVEYFERSGSARILVFWEKMLNPVFPDWKGEYWPNPGLSGAPALIRNDEQIDFNFGPEAPAAGLPADDFSARWSQWVTFDDGLYRFLARSDDGLRFFIDDRLVIDEWHISNGSELYAAERRLSGRHWLVVEYYEHTRDALVEFSWRRVTLTATPSPTPTSTATPTPTPTGTASPTPTSSATPTPTPTGTVSPTPTSSATPTPTPTGTASPTPTSTATPTSTPTGTASPTPTDTPTPTSTSTATGTATSTPTATDTPTSTPTHTPTLTSTPMPLSPVVINEILPVPASDWNGDGESNRLDQWVELRNVSTATVNLSGWFLVSKELDADPYEVPSGTTILADGYLVFYRADTGIELEDERGRIWLLSPDSTVAHMVSYGKLPPDVGLSRDEVGDWHDDWPPSPGEPNAPAIPAALSVPEVRNDLPSLLRQTLRRWFGAE